MACRAFAALCLAIAVAACAGADEGAGPGGGDEAALRQMNDDYVRSFLTCDVGRFRRLLGDDFRAVLASGAVIDKAEFLREAATPPDVRDFRLHDVTFRIYGDAALVGAAVSYRRADRTEVQTRYVDVYLRRAGRWQLVSAQWTRVSNPK